MIRLIGLFWISIGVVAHADEAPVRLLDDRIVFETAIKDVEPSVYELAKYLDEIDDPNRRSKSRRATSILEEWSEELTSFCAERGVNPYLAAAVIVAESNGQEEAVSHVGAAGLMQIMPGTAGDLSVLERKNGAESIYGGCRYLAQMLRRFEGDEVLSLAAYNAGPGAVKKRGGVPPFLETRRYIIRVARAWPEWPLTNRSEEDGSTALEDASDALQKPPTSVTFKLSTDVKTGGEK